MKLTLATFVSIDGVMQSPSDPAEDPRNGFALGGPTGPIIQGNHKVEAGIDVAH
jgi:hypothetical protein